MQVLVWCGAGALACGALALALRGKWDLVAAHSRGIVRHVLASVLMLGTLAGTVWTFSHGTLTLSGALERLVSVGGIAAALECGAIYTGWYIGQLDIRMLSARRREVAQQYRAYQASLYRWFYVVVGMSALANFLFRLNQLGNAPTAAFVSVAPIVLIVLFTIKLRPLPIDYAEVGRQATQRGLVTVVQQAQHAMIRGLTRMGRGERLDSAEIAQLQFAASLVQIYAPADEQRMLDHAIAQGTGAGTVIEGSAEVWLTTAEIMRQYDVSRRSAQDWIVGCPGRRKAARGNAWEVPASALYAVRGVPPGALSARSTSLLERPHARGARDTDAEPREGSAAARSEGAEATDVGAENTV